MRNSHVIRISVAIGFAVALGAAPAALAASHIDSAKPTVHVADTGWDNHPGSQSVSTEV